MNLNTDMKSTPLNRRHSRLLFAVSAFGCSCLLLLCAALQARVQGAAPPPEKARTFTTAEEAADALVAAAEQFDAAALKEILGPDSYDIVNTGEPIRDRETAAEFASLARTKKNISVDPRNPRRAFLLIGEDDWPFPVPLVKQGGKWFFDAKAGRQEILYRRV